MKISKHQIWYEPHLDILLLIDYSSSLHETVFYTIGEQCVNMEAGPIGMVSKKVIQNLCTYIGDL